MTAGHALHFLAGLAAGALAAGAILPAVGPLERAPAAAVVAAGASGSALLIGALKELADLGGRGDPSWADLGVTLLGGIAAGLVGAAVSALADEQPDLRGALGAACLCVGVSFALPVAARLSRRGEQAAAAATLSSGPRS